ncbi:hypothetical protein [Actinophytocola oryzae]|uniref:Uncharacterized protein n=1 Tax=Actinophytocola oryzae TaxID=502181 RepID=A0A4R7VY78_9PSEU|nr:hypothetical protein [Actinophytocola oryzae]TDV55126.1 hypothetical protein CLV71_103367 [Actinophytocola oryzae]
MNTPEKSPIIRAIGEELPGDPSPEVDDRLTIPGLVDLCAERGVSAPEVLARALDRSASGEDGEGGEGGDRPVQHPRGTIAQ